METTKSQTTTPFNFHENEVSKLALPEGAIARLGRGSVRDMAFSPDGQHFAAGSTMGLWIYKYPTFTPIALWETDRGFIDAVTFSPDSRCIAAYTYLQAIRVWDIQNGVCIAEMELSKEQIRWGISNPVFSQDGEHLVAFNGDNRKIFIWCSGTGTQISEIEIELSETETESINTIYPSCFSSDLSILAGSCYDHKNRTAEYIGVWEVETGKQINCLEWTERWGHHCFSQCGQFFAAGGSEGSINVWDVENGNLEKVYTGFEDANMVPFFSSENDLIAAMVFPTNPKIEIWDLEKNEKMDTLEKGSKLSSVRFSDDGTQLVYIDDGEIKFWNKDKSTEEALPSIHGHTRTVNSLAFTMDEDVETLVATYWGWKALFWDVSRRRGRRPTGADLPTSRTLHLYLSSKGKIIATGGDDDYLKVWENGSSEPITEIPIHEIKLTQITGSEAFAPTGDRLARTDRDYNIYVWDYKNKSYSGDEKDTWKLHAHLTGHTEYIEGVAFSPDAKQLASISRDRTARLWDVEAGKQITELPLAPPSGGRQYRNYDRGITFSPRGDLIAGGQWGEIILWDASNGSVLMTIPQPEGNQRPITLSFSPCGEYLFSGSWWQGDLQKVPIRLWKVATGENIATFSGHTTDVQCIAISKDCTVLASGGHDGVIFLWDLKPYINS
ncbi:MAG: hypothetical protein OXD54_13910 [Candidatus Poribacteria bacterium]|nr:hypothetical protein [Candidatus Poribacteria bacterium]